MSPYPFKLQLDDEERDFMLAALGQRARADPPSVTKNFLIRQGPESSGYPNESGMLAVMHTCGLMMPDPECDNPNVWVVTNFGLHCLGLLDRTPGGHKAGDCLRGRPPG